MTPLSATDYLFWLLERRQPMHTAMLGLFDKPDDPNFIPHLIAIHQQQATPQYPFNQILYKYLFWRKIDTIDNTQHFFYKKLAGDKHDLLTYVSTLHSQPLPKNRPLWQLYLLDGFIIDNKPAFAIYLKIHHALLDGIGGMRVTQKILHTDPNHFNSLPFWAIDSSATPHNHTASSTSHSHGIPTKTSLFYALKKYWNERNLPYVTKTTDAPKSPLNQTIDHSRMIGIQSYQKHQINAIASYFMVSSNDVILAVCAGALRRYLLDVNALPKKSLVGFVPISLRKDGSLSGNRLSFLLAKLATDTPCPLTRLQHISQSVKDSKARFEGLTYRQIIAYSIAIYGTAGLRLLTGYNPTQPAFNVIISAIPSNSNRLYINGAKMNGIYPISVLLHGQALNITVIHYAGQIDLAIIACQNRLPHSDKLLGFIDDEITTYLNLMTQSL